MSHVAPTRSTTLAGHTTYHGARIYTKNTNGECREARNSTSMSKISAGVRDQKPAVVDTSEGWFASDFRLSISPESALCSHGDIHRAGAVGEIYLYYQATTHELRCYQFLQNRDNEFSEQDAFLGTDMAVVYGTNVDSGRVVFFFQDTAGYLCCRRKVGRSQWDPKVQIVKACPRTGITLAKLEGIRDFCVYYQDEECKVCQLKCDYYEKPAKWSSRRIIDSVNRPLGTMAAVALGCNAAAPIRLYLQDDNDDIVEWCGSSSSTNWSLGDFRHATLPGSDILVYARGLDSNYGKFADSPPLVGVLWAGADQVLHQRVWAPTLGWLPSTPLAYLTRAGAFAGAWTGTRFRDTEAGIGHKTIQKIIGRTGDTLLRMQLLFTDGSSTAWRGSASSGDRQEFALSQGEDIAQIMVWHDGKTIQKLVFISSRGRTSPNFGKATGAPILWQRDGFALAGFSGSADQAIHGLMALWGDRPTGVGSSALRLLVEEAKGMEANVAAMRDRCAALQTVTEALQRELHLGLKPLANAALDGVEKLGTSIVALHKASSDTPPSMGMGIAALLEATTPSLVTANDQVALCKGQSTVVAERFRSLHKAAVNVLERASVNAVEATRETALADSQLERISEMKKISQAMKVNAEAVQQVRQGHVQECEQAISEAQKTQKQAEGKLAAYEPLTHLAARIILFGAMPLLISVDWNAQAQDMTKLIDSMQVNIDASKTSLLESQKALKYIETEMAHCDKISSSLAPYVPRLRVIKLDADTLRQTNQETCNKSSDVAGYLSQLAAKADTMKLGFTAQEFAQRVLDVQKVIDGRRPKGLMWDQPARLESTLQMIASSSVPAADVDDLM